jgi:hypothetical protein
LLDIPIEIGMFIGLEGGGSDEKLKLELFLVLSSSSPLDRMKVARENVAQGQDSVDSV